MAHAKSGGKSCWVIEPLELTSKVLADTGAAVALSAMVSARIPPARRCMRWVI
jgi:hypothetical protein